MPSIGRVNHFDRLGTSRQSLKVTITTIEVYTSVFIDERVVDSFRQNCSQFSDLGLCTISGSLDLESLS